MLPNGTFAHVLPTVRLAVGQLGARAHGQLPPNSPGATNVYSWSLVEISYWIRKMAKS